MFKKKLAALTAAALITLSSSSAFAVFADLELIRVYYDRVGNEYGTDLGGVKNIFPSMGNQPGGAFAGSFGDLSTGYAVYFAFDRTTNQLWASGSTTTPSVIVGGVAGFAGIKDGTQAMYSLYNTQGGTNYTGPVSNPNSYKNKLSTPQGSLGGSINSATRMNTEMSLNGLIGVAGQSRTQALYYWNNVLTTVAAEKIGIEVAKITTYSDGSTVIATAATPIPPAFILMGFGLMGMFGLRRRQTVT